MQFCRRELNDILKEKFLRIICGPKIQVWNYLSKIPPFCLFLIFFFYNDSGLCV